MHYRLQHHFVLHLHRSCRQKVCSKQFWLIVRGSKAKLLRILCAIKMIITRVRNQQYSTVGAVLCFYILVHWHVTVPGNHRRLKLLAYINCTLWITRLLYGDQVRVVNRTQIKLISMRIKALSCWDNAFYILGLKGQTTLVTAPSTCGNVTHNSRSATKRNHMSTDIFVKSLVYFTLNFLECLSVILMGHSVGHFWELRKVEAHSHYESLVHIPQIMSTLRRVHMTNEFEVRAHQDILLQCAEISWAITVAVLTVPHHHSYLLL